MKTELQDKEGPSIVQLSTKTTYICGQVITTCVALRGFTFRIFLIINFVNLTLQAWSVENSRNSLKNCRYMYSRYTTPLNEKDIRIWFLQGPSSCNKSNPGPPSPPPLVGTQAKQMFAIIKGTVSRD
jgi:hypothetical protein